MQSLQRGVKIRAVNETITSTNPDMDDIMNIEKEAVVTTKYLSKPPPALVSLSDDREVMIITSLDGKLETSALWLKQLKPYRII